jgi:hypothetical protein
MFHEVPKKWTQRLFRNIVVVAPEWYFSLHTESNTPATLQTMEIKQFGQMRRKEGRGRRANVTWKVVWSSGHFLDLRSKGSSLFGEEEIATPQDVMLARCMLERGQHAGLKKKGKLVYLHVVSNIHRRQNFFSACRRANYEAESVDDYFQKYERSCSKWPFHFS